MRLGVRWTRDSLECTQGVLSNLNYMEPHQQIKWAGNVHVDGSNVRLGVRWTRDSLEYAQGVLSNLNHQQIKWAGNWYRRNVRLEVKWAQNSMGYKQGVLSNLGISLQLILQQAGCTLHE